MYGKKMNLEQLNFLRIRKNYIILFYISFLLPTIAIVSFPALGAYGYQYIWGILINSIITSMCAIDAKIHGKNIIDSYKMLLFFTGFIGLTVYILYTRKRKGFKIIIKHSLVLIVLLLVSILLVSTLKSIIV